MKWVKIRKAEHHEVWADRKDPSYGKRWVRDDLRIVEGASLTYMNLSAVQTITPLETEGFFLVQASGYSQIIWSDELGEFAGEAV